MQRAQNEPIPWMEDAAIRAVRVAQDHLGYAIWSADAILPANVPGGEHLAPRVWEHIRDLIGRVMDTAATLMHEARQSAHAPDLQPSTSTDTSQGVLAECPVCYGRPNRVIRPCGHVICQNCIDRVSTCPVCKQLITHSFNLFLT